MNKDLWFSGRLALHRASTPHPGTTCWRCGALAQWRETDERGRPTPGYEWCFCSGCGRRLPGQVSPWSAKAKQDWDNTRYMRRHRRQRDRDHAHRRVKFDCLGRRTALAGN